MSITSEINRINNNIAGAYTAISAKGGTLPTTQNSANLATAINSISGGSVPSGVITYSQGSGNNSKNITFSGDWGGGSWSGTSTITTSSSNVTFSVATSSVPSLTGVRGQFIFGSDSILGDQSSFCRGSGVTSVYSDVFTTLTGGLASGFRECNNLTTVSLPSFTTIAQNRNAGMYGVFRACPNLTSVSMPSLKSVYGNNLGAFVRECSSLTSVDLSSLETIGLKGLENAFTDCTSLTTVSFPSLINVDTTGDGTFSNTFVGCTALTEIHFRSDIQSTMESMPGYSSKWGATNATIYFDL